MQRKNLLAAVAAVGMAAAGAVVQAHHSHGNYESTFTDLEGVVTEVHLINPHSWIYLEVAGENGRRDQWALEATSRIGLQRIGVTPDSLRPGDRVRVRCHPLRDGSRGCLLGFVKTADGSVTDWDGTRLPTPDGF